MARVGEALLPGRDDQGVRVLASCTSNPRAASPPSWVAPLVALTGAWAHEAKIGQRYGQPRTGPLAPGPIRTTRLVLRESSSRDRAAFIELFASPEVGTYLGGSRQRDELEGAMSGIVALDQRGATGPGQVCPEADEVELGYMFLPGAWGRGFAVEACVAAPGWVTSTLPGEPAALCTRV